MNDKGKLKFDVVLCFALIHCAAVAAIEGSPGNRSREHGSSELGSVSFVDVMCKVPPPSGNMDVENLW